MAGSIRKRADKGANAYELRVYLGRDDTGRTRHKSTLFRGTRRAAEMELARLVTDQADEPSRIPRQQEVMFGPSMTLNMAIEAWRHNGWQDLSPSTTQRYESIWSKHVKRTIGRRHITSLGPYDVELYLRGLKASGLSESSVRQTRAMLHRACRLARKWSGNVLPNPVSGTEMPDWVLHEQPQPVRAPTLEEVKALLEASKALGSRMYAYLAVITATGMRRGEACALRWGDVDLKEATVAIDESIVAAAGGAQIKPPKSRAGLRSVAIDNVTLRALERFRFENEQLASVGEFTLENEHFVFATDLPGVLPPHPDTMSTAFARIRSAAGVSADIHLHSLRHFQATVLDSVISEAQKQSRLGWSTVHMARHYTDSVEEEDRRAAAHLGDLLSGDAETAPHVGQTPGSDNGARKSPNRGAAAGSTPSSRRSTGRRATRRRPLT
jgi:integrase